MKTLTVLFSILFFFSFQIASYADPLPEDQNHPSTSEWFTPFSWYDYSLEAVYFGVTSMD